MKTHTKTWKLIAILFIGLLVTGAYAAGLEGMSLEQAIEQAKTPQDHATISGEAP